jgi:catechol 2,3-dioxygenase-like lactoylglutathione lyase family enzyme
MLRGIDHLVIAVADLEAAADELTAQVGLACTAGGRHPDASTINRIAFLGEAYVELIAVEDEKRAANGPVGTAVLRALDAGGGLATYALVDDALDATVARLQANGRAIGPVTHGSRQRPDGEMVEWRVATLERLGIDSPPFLIRHAPVGVEWGVAAVRQRRELVHPIGSPAVLLGLDIAVSDPTAVAAEYLAQLELEFRMVDDLAVCALGPHTIRILPDHHLDMPAAIVIGAGVAAPRSVSALGLRFDIQPVSAVALGGHG